MTPTELVSSHYAACLPPIMAEVTRSPVCPLYLIPCTSHRRQLEIVYDCLQSTAVHMCEGWTMMTTL